MVYLARMHVFFGYIMKGICYFSKFTFYKLCFYRLEAVRKYNTRLVRQIQGMAAVPQGQYM